MSERDEAIALAGRVLDRINADPDDDLAVLARQFLRETAATERYRWLRDGPHTWDVGFPKPDLMNGGEDIPWSLTFYSPYGRTETEDSLDAAIDAAKGQHENPRR